jgi:short-subunit dehydrogenase
MQARVDSKRCGPWALVTGASSGIGHEFARQIAASHINVVLVARRQALLDALGTELSRDFGVKHRVVVADLSDEGFIAGLADATRDLDIVSLSRTRAAAIQENLRTRIAKSSP